MDKNTRNKEKRLFIQMKNSNSLFIERFNELLSSKIDSWNDRDKEYILSCALLFLNYYNQNPCYKNYFRIGYYIILKYSILFKDYKPLYDISLQIGFYPISDYILKHGIIQVDSLSEELINKSISEHYLYNNSYVETFEQYINSREILSNKLSDVVYVAPTSYGKSSLIKDVIKTFRYDKIGIIVPTKSLLTQIYNDIKSLNLDYKLVLHDEMYSDKYNRFIGVLTQERATRLLSKHQVCFDLMIIDEAHNLFNDDPRSIILSRLILLNHCKKQDQRVIYLSPLVDDSQNLKLRRINANFITKGINHDLKTFEIYYWKNNKSYIYNRFNDCYINLSENVDFWSYIHNNAKKKNFVYLYRPKHIEDFAKALYSKLSPITINEELSNVITTLKKEVHPSFYMISMLERGIVYLHAKMPTIIKEYLEAVFKKEPAIRFMIANKVVLEGVNHPIDNMFIASTYSMQGKQLINLIGRVNRLNEVFLSASSSLSRLISTIHFIEHPDYSRNDMRNKMVLLRDYSFSDEINNPLIESYNVDKKRDPQKTLKDKNIINTTDTILYKTAETLYDRVEKYILENDIASMYKDFSKVSFILEQNINKFVFSKELEIVDIVYNIFIQGLESQISDDEIHRLKNSSSIKYYNIYLSKIQKMSLNEKITVTVKHFKKNIQSNTPLLYIGASYGECSNYVNGAKVYVNLSKKKESELVNLAIVKLKIEEDFVNYKLIKLIQFLHDFDIITDDYYNKYVYGTNDKTVIDLVRQGLGVNVVKKIVDDNQIDNLYWDQNGNLKANEVFIRYKNKQSPLVRFELEKYLI
ncbi:DEAD/DEAH box helicase [Bacteroides fragilis]|uniref:DEAD/DEAH box helicase n=1 Tax=Bacteroides fragilis TaxID=817 RepID=UPI0022AA8D2A|nr:DEAD/DEAH box helicase [Bacteroides fragilis]MCZ2635047.1 DEAD/DEAH box helicase [Bacteroides fragilis]